MYLGTMETMAGKISRNPNLVERGQERKVRAQSCCPHAGVHIEIFNLQEGFDNNNY